MRIVNGKGVLPADYRIEVVTTDSYVSVEMHIKVTGMEKRVFLDNHTVIGNNPDMLVKTALIEAEQKWGIELLQFDLNKTTT